MKSNELKFWTVSVWIFIVLNAIAAILELLTIAGVIHSDSYTETKGLATYALVYCLYLLYVLVGALRFKRAYMPQAYVQKA